MNEQQVNRLVALAADPYSMIGQEAARLLHEMLGFSGVIALQAKMEREQRQRERDFELLQYSYPVVLHNSIPLGEVEYGL